MPYKLSHEYMTWSECRALCPKGAIKETNYHHWIDEKLCDRCYEHQSYLCGGIFQNNSPHQLQDFNTYWQEWFTNYHQLIENLKKRGEAK